MDKKKLDLKDDSKCKPMVKWFSPKTLWILAKQKFIAEIFGNYSDRRLTHAALYPFKDDDIKSQIDYRKIKPRKDNEIWIDFVSDLGDGFDSTYSVAYLLGQPNIQFEQETIPRGDILIMGGDEVYPNPSRDNYVFRMEKPYESSFPNSGHKDAEHPYLFLLPGNHDWYDGLTLFLAKFCNGDRNLGSWRISQKRSYFVIQLIDNWWIFGIDTQLGEDIDTPQNDYFKRVAEINKQQAQNAKIILCVTAPTWLSANSEVNTEKEKFKRGVDHVATKIIKNCWPNAKIYAVLTGDYHHYSRYISKKPRTQFITAGGGGAFLHPTHGLEKEINKVSWMGNPQTLKLDKLNDKLDGSSPLACYPSRSKSRKLALGNFKFFRLNKSFCALLGIVYTFIASMLIFADAAPKMLTKFEWVKFLTTLLHPSFVLTTLVVIFVLYWYANSKKTSQRILIGVLHALFHMVVISFLVGAVPILNIWLTSAICILNCSIDISYWYSGWSLVFLVLEIGLFGFLFGGLIWGTYLVIMSHCFSLHSDDSFSAMRLTSYKNFLRICLSGDSLKIYPVGIKEAIPRSRWRENPLQKEDNQNEPEIVPIIKEPFYEPIEKPIIIRWEDV